MKPRTPEEVRELFARKHAEGAARVRAILESEAPAAKPKRTRALDTAGARHVVKLRHEELAREARALGAYAFRLDIRTPNPANLSRGSARLARASMVKRHRLQAGQLTAIVVRAPIAGPVRVVLTRIAPSSGLDPHDALPGALKAVVDGVADGLGLPNDRDPRVTWTYAQRRGRAGEHAVEVFIVPEKIDATKSAEVPT